MTYQATAPGATTDLPPQEQFDDRAGLQGVGGAQVRWGIRPVTSSEAWYSKSPTTYSIQTDDN